jgi:hypothetical protein
MKRVQRVAVCQMSYVVCRMPYAVYRGTVFRYCPEFRHAFEDNGTGFCYLDLSGEKGE